MVPLKEEVKWRTSGVIESTEAVCFSLDKTPGVSICNIPGMPGPDLRKHVIKYKTVI